MPVWLKNWSSRKGGNCLLIATDFYGEEMERHKHDFVFRNEGGEIRDRVKEIESWIKSPRNFLLLSGEGGIGKSRCCIEAAKRNEMTWINLRGLNTKNFQEAGQGKEKLERILKAGMILVFEDYQEYRRFLSETVSVVLRKKAKLLILSREPDPPRRELKNWGQIPLEIHLKRIGNVPEITPLDDSFLLSQIVKISEGNPAIARMAVEHFQMTKNLNGIKDRYELFNSVYQNIEERMPEILPTLAKMALVRGMSGNPFAEHEERIREVLSAGQITQEGNFYRIRPDILNDHIVKKYYFIPYVRARFEESVEEFIQTKAREMLTTLIHLNQKEACKVILEKSKELDTPTVIDLGLAAYEKFEDRGFVVKSLGEFWTRVWELEDPDPYNSIAHLLHRDLSKREEAARCWEKALSLYERKRDELGVAQTYYNLGSVEPDGGNSEKARQFYRWSLEIKEKLGDFQGMIQAYNTLGKICRREGEYERTIQFYEKSLAITERLVDFQGMAQTYGNLGSIYSQKGDWESAIQFYEKSLEITEKVGELKASADHSLCLGSVYLQKDDFEKAIHFYEKALKTFKKLGNLYGMSQAYGSLGSLYSRQGEYEQAIRFHEKSLEIFEKLEDIPGMAKTYNNLGSVFRRKGDWGKAIQFYEKTLIISEGLGDLQRVAQIHGKLGSVYYSQGDYKRTIQFYEKELEIKEKLGDIHGMAKTYNNLGLVHSKRGDIGQALHFYEKSLAIKKKLEDIHGMAKTYNNLGIVYRRKGDWGKAIQFYERDLAISERLGDLQGMAQTQGNIGSLYLEQGRLEEAEKLLLNSFATFAELGAKPDAATAYGALQDLITKYRRQDDEFGMRRVEKAIRSL